MNILKNWKRWLPIIGVLLFIYILMKINLGSVLDEVKDVDLFFIWISLVFVIFMLFTETLKWFAIAVAQNIRVGFWEAFKITLISNFYGFVTPSKLGSVIRAEYLRNHTGNIGKGLCNFTIDKILDIASIIFIAVLFSFIFKDRLNLPIWLFVGMFLTLVFLMIFFVNKKRSKFVLGLVFKKLIPLGLRDKSKLTFDSFYENMPRKRYFILFFVVNVFNWVIVYSTAYFIGLSLGIELPFVYYLAILPIGTLVTLIPISINGLGTREATLISLFGLFGVGAAKVFSMSILSLLIAGILPCIIGSFFIFGRRLQIK